MFGSIEKFSVYLTGRKFVVQTDHKALKWLNQMKEQNGRLTRWSLSLQPYSFTVEHRAGRLHANADALSRVDVTRCFAHQKEGEMWPTGSLIEKSISGEIQAAGNYQRDSHPPCTTLLGVTHPPGNSQETSQPTGSIPSGRCYATETSV